MKKFRPKIFFRIFNRFSSHLSFQSRLLMAFFIIALPVLTFVCIVSVVFFTQSSEDVTMTSQAVSLEKIQNQLRYITEDTESLSKDIIFNANVQYFLEQSYKGELYPDDSSVAYFINNFIANRDFIDCVIITGPDTTLFSTEKAYTDVSSFENISSESWFEELEESSGGYLWFATDNGLMLCRSIYNSDDYTTLYGYVIIYLNSDYIQEIWDSVNLGSTTNLFLCDSDGNILIQNDISLETETDYSELIPSISTSTEIELLKSDHTKYVAGTQGFTEDDWTLYIITPFDEINSYSTLINVYILTIIGVVIIIFLMVGRFSAKSMSAPIENLSKIMDNYNLKKQLPADMSPSMMYEDREDEIGNMYRSYKQMIERMSTLVDEIYIKSLEKKDAELALLQSQINPHFLYNTLDSINWLAMSNDQDEISEMVTALSDTFRLSLMKSNSPYIKLSKEIEYLNSYLILQKFRYSAKLSYEFFTDDNTLECMIPKFILQPIVENALKHGIDKLDNGGKLEISSYFENDNVIIKVQNDGADIDLDKINSSLAFDPDSMELLAFKKNGYGVQNIHRRIRIICGKEYGLSYSVKENNTICCVTLPIKEQTS